MADMSCGCDTSNEEGQPLTWTYVGQGRGDFEQSKDLQFVGVGRGSYVQERVRAPVMWWRPCVCLLCLLAVLLLMVVVLWHLFQRPVEEREIEITAPAVAIYHCHLPMLGAAAAGAAIVEESWSAIDLDSDGLVSKASFKLWESQGLFSKAAIALFNTTDEDNDGMITNDEYVEALKLSTPQGSEEQQWAGAAWVLADKNSDGIVTRSEMGFLQQPGSLKNSIDEHLFKGDQTGDGKLTRHEFDRGLALVAAADAGAIDALFHQVQYKYWDQPKKQFCCSVEGVGCHAPVPTTVAPAYDCHTGVEHSSSWPEMKRAWCCGHNRVACSSRVSAPYDCDAGLSNWQAGWSEHKKAWCCFHTSRGCTRASEPYDCQAGLSNWKAGWSGEKKTWCCQNKGTGCMPEYDCHAGLSNWRAGWSPSKKTWCCHHFELGCEQSLPFDCAAGLSNWRSGWSPQKKQWCCAHEQKGCEVVSKPYDCLAGLSNWRAGWSPEKKTWCCSHEHRGCETAAQYDCSAGYSNWQAGWSPSKKVWCCHHEGKGCVY